MQNDVRWPDRDGLALASELRERVKDRPIVVVLGASVLPSEQDAAVRLLEEGTPWPA